MRITQIGLALLISGCSNLDPLDSSPFSDPIDTCEDYILEDIDGSLGCYETRPWFGVSGVGTNFFSRDWIHLNIQAAQGGGVVFDHVTLDFYTTIHESDEPDELYISSVSDRLFVVYPDDSEYPVTVTNLDSYPATIEIGGVTSPNLEVEAGETITLDLYLDSEGLDEYMFFVAFNEVQSWSDENGTHTTIIPDLGVGMGISN